MVLGIYWKCSIPYLSIKPILKSDKNINAILVTIILLLISIGVGVYIYFKYY